MPVRDNEGAVRIFEPGRVPLPDDVMAYHRQKIAERAKAEGRPVCRSRWWWTISTQSPKANWSEGRTRNEYREQYPHHARLVRSGLLLVLL